MVAGFACRATRRVWVWLVPLSGVLVVTLLAAGAARADGPPPAQELSQFETYWGNSLDRDCGFSQQLASGKSLWLFCDTQVYNLYGQPGAFIAGATAAEGSVTSGEVPTTLTEVPTPPASLSSYPANGGPQQFLAPPKDVHAPGGGACSGPSHTYAASWPSGMTALPNTSPQQLLISYDEVCVYSGTPYVEGLALIEYQPSTNSFVAGPWEVFAPSASGAVLPNTEQLGSPIISGGFLYLFSGTCNSHDAYGDCLSGSVYLASTLPTPSYWESASTYYWEDASGWTHSPSGATSIIAGATPEDPAAVTVASYPGKGLALITETNLGGGYQVWMSGSGNPAAGNWSAGPSGASLSGCSSGQGLNLCRALTGHPEISNSSEMLMSYFDPAIEHVYVVAVPW